jgi:hypothetical protein
MEDNPIKKALRRLEGAEPRVIIRGGEIVKIPCQTLELQEKDGVVVIYKIPADITM